MSFSEQVKSKLLNIISEMAQHPDDFSMHPAVDFSRKRKLDFATFLHIFISMEAGTVRDELLKYFSYNNGTVSNSAFFQQRAKLSETAIPYLFYSFSNSYPYTLYRGGNTSCSLPMVLPLHLPAISQIRIPISLRMGRQPMDTTRFMLSHCLTSSQRSIQTV